VQKLLTMMAAAASSSNSFRTGFGRFGLLSFDLYKLISLSEAGTV